MRGRQLLVVSSTRPARNGPRGNRKLLGKIWPGPIFGFAPSAPSEGVTPWGGGRFCYAPSPILPMVVAEERIPRPSHETRGGWIARERELRLSMDSPYTSSSARRFISRPARANDLSGRGRVRCTLNSRDDGGSCRNLILSIGKKWNAVTL